MRAIKTFFALVILSLTSATLYAQGGKKDVFFNDLSYKDRNSGSFGKHFSILSFGYGFGIDLPTYGDDDDDFDKNYWDAIGPFYAKYEHGITDEIGLGVHFSYTWLEAQWRDGLVKNIYNGGVMGFYHFNKLINTPSTDFYLGAGFGYSFLSEDLGKASSGYEQNIKMDAFVPAFRVGVRQYLGGNFAIYGEVGTDKACIANMGISINLSPSAPGHKPKHSAEKTNPEDETNNDEEVAPPQEKKKTEKKEDY